MGEHAIPAGMKAWAGGNEAPADWDGGPVLLATGAVIDASYTWRSHYPEGYLARGRVLAYTPKSDRLAEHARSVVAMDGEDDAALVEAMARALWAVSAEPEHGANWEGMSVSPAGENYRYHARAALAAYRAHQEAF